MYKKAKEMQNNDAPQHVVDLVRERAAALLPSGPTSPAI